MTPTPHGRRRRTLIIGLSAAVTLILLGTAVAAAWLFGDTLADAKPAANALSAETQIECTSIRREFEAWDKDVTRLDTMVKPSVDRGAVRYELNKLKEAGDAFAKATTGYTDQPSKDLHLAVLNYNVDFGMVSLEHQLSGGTVNETAKEKAMKSAVAVEQAYRAFAKQTCKQG